MLHVIKMYEDKINSFEDDWDSKGPSNNCSNFMNKSLSTDWDWTEDPWFLHRSRTFYKDGDKDDERNGGRDYRSQIEEGDNSQKDDDYDDYEGLINSEMNK